MLRMIAIDDELHSLERFRRIADACGEVDFCGAFNDQRELMEYIKANTVDAVFIDIEMPGKSGLLLAEDILNVRSNIEIIFLTAYSQYAVEAFELSAVDYLLKPLLKERFEKTVARLAAKKQTALPENKRVRVDCFGSFSVCVGAKILSWKNQKAKELLAFLVHCNGVPVSWDKITEALWYEFDYEKAQVNLHTTMYRLRKKLAEEGVGEIIESVRGNYRVKKEEIDCDYYTYLETGDLPRGAGRYLEEEGYDWALARCAEIKRLKNTNLNKL